MKIYKNYMINGMKIALLIIIRSEIHSLYWAIGHNNCKGKNCALYIYKNY